MPLNEAKNIATNDEDDLKSELGADNASWSSGTIGDDGIGGESSSGSSPASPRQTMDESDSDEWDEQNDDVPLTRNNRRDAKNTNTADKKSTSISQSTFLPSLSVGFIKGSDDSIDEGDGHAADMPRKNRRGQRARRLYVHSPRLIFLSHLLMIVSGRRNMVEMQIIRRERLWNEPHFLPRKLSRRPKNHISQQEQTSSNLLQTNLSLTDGQALLREKMVTLVSLLRTAIALSETPE